MTDPTPVSLPIWESIVADYGDPLADLHADDPAPQTRTGLPPVPERPAPPTPPEPRTTPLPAVGRGSTTATPREAP